MKVLNLDPYFSPVQGPHLSHTIVRFSGGEVHISIDPIKFVSEDVVITSRVRCSDDIMLILLAADALKGMGFKNIDLYIPYIPYARQDRRTSVGEPISIKIFANLINSVGFNKVIVVDPHSYVSTVVIDNCEVNDGMAYAVTMVNAAKLQDCILIVPDAGAMKRCETLNKFVHFPGMYQCTKMRDYKGNIVKTHINAAPDQIKGKSFFIFDDICDGGRTFIEIAKVLKEYGAKEVFLYVTHGIFSHGFDEIFKYIDKVYCTNSFKDVEMEGVYQIKLDSYTIMSNGEQVLR